MFDALAVLLEQRVIEIVPCEEPRHPLRHERRNHERRHESELVRHFEDDQNARHRGPDDGGEAAAHPDHGEQDVGGSVEGNGQAEQAGRTHAGHRSEAQGGGENAAAAPRPITDCGRQQFCDEQNCRVKGEHPAVEGRQRSS